MLINKIFMIGSDEMYKIICNWTYAVIWRTKNRNQAEMIAKKYGAAIYKRNEKILDYK